MQMILFYLRIPGLPYSISCQHVSNIDMMCGTKKSVCMICEPRDRTKIMNVSFPQFTLEGCSLQFAKMFKYLGHMITDSLSDDDDMQREIRNLFTRTNILVRRFGKCSVVVKIVLFKAYCISLYDAGLWVRYKQGSLNKLLNCYNKCLKLVFGYKRRDSVTQILFHLGTSKLHSCL